jgi:nucleoside phosphorylase
VNGTPIQVFRIGSHRVVAARMGAGNVETAINVSNVLSRRTCDLVISVGPAGNLSDQKINSCVLVKKVVGYQRGTWGKSGWELAPGAVHNLDESLIESSLSKELGFVAVASGEAFVSQGDARARLFLETGCALVDMNSFGLTSVCRKAQVPLTMLKIVSDHADANAGEDFKSFVANYDGSLGAVVRAALEKLPVSKNSPAAHERIRELLDR